MLPYFYEIRMTFPKSASKNLSHIQSTAKHIFLQAPYRAVLFLYSGITDDLGNWLWSCNSSCKMSKFPCLQNHIMIDFHAFSWFSKQRFVISNEAEQIRKFITGKFAVISVFLLWFSILKSCWKPEYFTHLWQSNEENFDKYGNFA